MIINIDDLKHQRWFSRWRRRDGELGQPALQGSEHWQCGQGWGGEESLGKRTSWFKKVKDSISCKAIIRDGFDTDLWNWFQLTWVPMWNLNRFENRLDTCRRVRTPTLKSLRGYFSITFVVGTCVSKQGFRFRNFQGTFEAARQADSKNLIR